MRGRYPKPLDDGTLNKTYSTFYKARLRRLLFNQNLKNKDFTILDNAAFAALVKNQNHRKALPLYLQAKILPYRLVAGGQGIEPWITGPEPVVLPLYYPPTKEANLAISLKKSS